MPATYDCVIEQIVQSIFSTMLELELLRANGPSAIEDDSILAAIQIAGEWMGSVVLELPADVARKATASMLQIPLAEVALVDQCDVAAELVNMVGGNLKSLLPGPSFLSLPTIVSGRAIGLQVHDAELIDEVSLTCEAGDVRVWLYARLTPLSV